MYGITIIILLTNDLTDLCGEISKIRLVLWMVYTCNVKGLEEVEMLGNVLYIVECTYVNVFANERK